MTNKIEPFRSYFENMHAMLSRIGEDENVYGFVGCLIMKDGSLADINFNANRGDMALTGARCLRDALAMGPDDAK